MDQQVIHHQVLMVQIQFLVQLHLQVVAVEVEEITHRIEQVKLEVLVVAVELEEVVQVLEIVHPSVPLKVILEQILELILQVVAVELVVQHQIKMEDLHQPQILEDQAQLELVVAVVVVALVALVVQVVAVELRQEHLLVGQMQVMHQLTQVVELVVEECLPEVVEQAALV